MNITIHLQGADVTDICRLADTRIQYDSTKRISTAEVTILGRTTDEVARYDYAHYDADQYAADVRELYVIEIRDGRDGSTIFKGEIFALDFEQSDAATFQAFCACHVNDYAAWLDRAVCWSPLELPFPCSDRTIIRNLITWHCPRINVDDVAEIVPVILDYDWQNKTCRQVLDDMAALSMADWHVDYEAKLHYHLASAAPAAPFALSTSPDLVNSFPVNVSGYKHDFTNPINRCFVRGAADPTTGMLIQAEYADPISIGIYGEQMHAIVNDQLTTAWDASLLAKSTVLRYAYPQESGSFTIWKDGLKCGQQVSITEENLGIEGEYIIRQLTLQWQDQWTVQYDAQFGAAQPDLETLLRMMDARSKWKSSKPPPASGPPPPGSVTDASIAPPGLHEGSIATVNAGSMVGIISAEHIGGVAAQNIIGLVGAQQIGGVYASALVGSVSADQIAGINASVIQGSISAGQIGSVNAATIQGVIVSSQVADGLIDDLAKYSAALRPVRTIKATDPWPPVMPNDDFPPGSFFYFEANGHFYEVTEDGMTWIDRGTNADVLGTMRFYHIGAISAKSITGLIAAAQIETITAGQITGMIQAGQIQAVNASSISGAIQASQIAGVNAGVIQGTIASSQIASITADKISGLIHAGQISSINAQTITIGLIVDGQIANINGAKLTVGTVDTDKLNTNWIDVGGGPSKPARLRVFDATTLVGQLGYLDSSANYGGWFKVFGAGGTYYGDAKVKTDLSGNLSINDASFTVTHPGSGSSVVTSPANYDATYSSVSLNVQDATNATQHVSRGVVVMQGSWQCAAIVRGPTSGAGEVVVRGNNVIKIHLNGVDGVCRADGGYVVGATSAINNAGTYVGPGVNTAGAVNGQNFWVKGTCRIDGALTSYTGYYAGPYLVIRNDGRLMATTGLAGVASEGVWCGSQDTLSFHGGLLVAVTRALARQHSEVLKVPAWGGGYYELTYEKGTLAEAKHVKDEADE